MDEVSPTIIGSFPANDNSGDRVDIYNDMSYRYEPKFTLGCFPNSLLKIENDDVYYMHPRQLNAKWHASYKDYFGQNVKRIIDEHIVEKILIKGEGHVND